MSPVDNPESSCHLPKGTQYWPRPIGTLRLLLTGPSGQNFFQIFREIVASARKKRRSWHLTVRKRWPQISISKRGFDWLPRQNFDTWLKIVTWGFSSCFTSYVLIKNRKNLALQIFAEEDRRNVKFLHRTYPKNFCLQKRRAYYAGIYERVVTSQVGTSSY